MQFFDSQKSDKFQLEDFLNPTFKNLFQCALDRINFGCNLFMRIFDTAQNLKVSFAGSVRTNPRCIKQLNCDFFLEIY